MKKLLFVSLIILFISSILFAQTPITKEKLAKAESKGKVVFKSILKDVDLKVNDNNQQGWWLLKFENGAVFRRSFLFNENTPEKRIKGIWWIGKMYLVRRVSGGGFEVNLIEEEKQKKNSDEAKEEKLWK